MNREPMRRWLKEDRVMMRELIAGKLSSIQQLKGEKPVYLETNHCFIKGFGWELMEHLPAEKVLVLVLKRNRQEVVDSLYRIKCTPLNRFGSEWLIQPARKGIAGVSAPGFVFFRCMYFFDYWYTRVNNRLGKRLPDFLKTYKMNLLKRYYHFTYRLGERFFEKFGRVNRMDISLGDLNNPEWVEAFCKQLGIAFTPAMQEKLGKRVNEKRG